MSQNLCSCPHCLETRKQQDRLEKWQKANLPSHQERASHVCSDSHSL